MAVNWLDVHYIEKPQIRVSVVFPKRGAPLLAQVARHLQVNALMRRRA